MMIDKQYLIETNVKILKRHERLTGEKVWIGTTKTIDDIIPKIDSVGNSGNRKDDLIEKATHIIAFIPWAQPFEDGNRRTAIISATKFLHDNGYELGIESGKENLEIRKMVSEIKKYRRGLNADIMNQLSFYIAKRIKLYDS